MFQAALNRIEPVRERQLPLNPGPVAPLAPYDLVALFKGAFAFAIFALLFLFAGDLLHIVPRIGWSSLT
jgi:hypothetical protein